ncbi:MAG: glycosyltransferase [Acidobacteria bacterium]|nr:MAG: glycosyltransferase [Acidobacteriota bacterium]
MNRQRLTVVMPVLNEAARIETQLARLRAIDGIDEVIVVDGGSTDGTRDAVKVDRWCQIVRARRGRGSQMNAGAMFASGDVLLFLHADVTLPSNAAALIHRALEDPSVVAGAFRTRTIAEGSTRWVRHWLWMADIRSRVARLPYGDQALFVRRHAFARAGGFPAQTLFEDFEISRRLRHIGRIATLPASVVVSGRRFLARPFFYLVAMNTMPILYRLGVPVETLSRMYGAVR